MASVNRLATRRKFITVTALFGVGVLAAACGAAATPTPAPPAPAATPVPQGTAPTPTAVAKPKDVQTPATVPTAAAPPKSAAPTTFNFWGAHSGAKECQAYKDMAAEYTKIAPNVTVGSVQCGAGEQNFKEVLLARIAAGDPPDLTIVWDTPVSLGIRGSLLALDDLMKTSKYSARDNWPSGVLASCLWAGKTYGFPTMSAAYGMFYNQEWFEKQGIPAEPKDFPKTWDELRQLSKQFTKWNGDTLETAGFIPDWASNHELFPMWVGLNGSKVFDPDNRKYTIDADLNVATLDYMLSWLDEEYLGDITKVQKSGSWGMAPGQQGQQPAFQTQKLAALMDGSWWMNFMYSEVKPTFERWNVAPMPVGPNGTKPVGAFWPNWWAIPKGAKAPEAAFDYLDWVNGDGIRTWFTTIADLPPNKKFPRDLLPEVTVQYRGKEFTKQVLDYFYSQFETSVPMWTSPVEDFGLDQLARVLERVIRKVATPKDALAEAQKASQAELEKVLQANPS